MKNKPTLQEKILKIIRNKKCKECPQNRREDIVWQKGYQDGQETGLYWAKQIIQIEIEKMYRQR